MYFISRYSKLTEFGLKLSSTTRWLLTGALLLALLSIWYIFGYTCLDARLNELALQKKQLAAEQSALSALRKKNEQLEALVSAQKTAWNTTAQHMQEQAGHDSLFALFDIFSKRGITVQSYSPRGQVDRGWYTKSSAQVQFLATFEQLLELCDALAEDKVPYSVTHVRLERRDNKIFCVLTLNQKIPKGIV